MENKIIKLKQGDTLSIGFKISNPLGDKDLKFGLYSLNGKTVYEAYVSQGTIVKVDDTHYSLDIPHEISRTFTGAMTARCAVYLQDKSFVNAGENSVKVMFEEELVTRTLR